MNIINNFKIQNETFYFYDLSLLYKEYEVLLFLPIVLKILLEANLRKAKDEEEFNKVLNVFLGKNREDIHFYPSRIIMENFDCITTLLDLADMREEALKRKKDSSKINPSVMLDILLDDFSTSTLNNEAFEKKHDLYTCIKWAEKTFSKIRVIPPGSGMNHDLHLEYLSSIIHLEQKDNKNFIYPEMLLCHNSFNVMHNSLGVFAYNLEGIQVKKAIFSSSFCLKLPKVLGINIQKELKEGLDSNDIVHALCMRLNTYDLKGKLIEFYGEGLHSLSLEDRATILKLCPKYGAISAFFAIDDKSISYFNKTRKNEDFSKIIKVYLEKQKMYFGQSALRYDEDMIIDLSKLSVMLSFLEKPSTFFSLDEFNLNKVKNEGKKLHDYDIVFARISSCISTSNPYILIHSALLAKKAYEFGIRINARIKCSLELSSLKLKEYLVKLDLLKYFEYLGFFIIIAESCDISLLQLEKDIEEDIKNYHLKAVSLSSLKDENSTKTHALVKINYLMSPSLLISYALLGNTACNILESEIMSVSDEKIYLKDIWPSNDLMKEYLDKLDYCIYKNIYQDVFLGNELWKAIAYEKKDLYPWPKESITLQSLNVFQEQSQEKITIDKAGILLLLGDNIKSDEISPLGQIPLYSEAGEYLEKKGIKSYAYNTFLSRNSNAQVMVRGSFDSDTLANKMLFKEGAFTKDYESLEIISVFEKSQRFFKKKQALVIFAGKEYGEGTSNEWAAKGTALLGVQVVIASSFSPLHKRDLISYGVLPCEFLTEDIKSLALQGDEIVSLHSLGDTFINEKLDLTIYAKNKTISLKVLSRIDNEEELKYYKEGGVLSYLLNKILDSQK